nr:MAG TPA: hypothetical protein [Caudoviricetes sp.]
MLFKFIYSLFMYMKLLLLLHLNSEVLFWKRLRGKCVVLCLNDKKCFAIF